MFGDGRYLSSINTPKRLGRKISKASLQQRLVDAPPSRSRRPASTRCFAAEVRDLQSRRCGADSFERGGH